MFSAYMKFSLFWDVAPRSLVVVYSRFGATFQPHLLEQCFSTAGPRPDTGPWHQLYRAARGSPGICHFSFLSSFHE